MPVFMISSRLSMHTGKIGIRSKGKGYKPFRRWEYFMEPRVYPAGKLPAVSLWQDHPGKTKLHGFVTGSDIDWTFIRPVRSIRVDINTKEIGGAGRINCIAFHPADSLIMWAGAPSGGIWKTTDGGNTWTPTGDQLSAIGISDIAVDPKNPDNMYIATGDGDCLRYIQRRDPEVNRRRA